MKQTLLKGKDLRIGMYVVLRKTSKTCRFAADSGVPMLVERTAEYPFVGLRVYAKRRADRPLFAMISGAATEGAFTYSVELVTSDVRKCRFQQVTFEYLESFTEPAPAPQLDPSEMIILDDVDREP